MTQPAKDETSESINLLNFQVIHFHTLIQQRQGKMKPYSLDMRQKIVDTYEAGNTSIRKVAERFQRA